jgi:hypothetical protein
MHIHCVCGWVCVFERECVYAYVVYMYTHRESERSLCVSECVFLSLGYGGTHTRIAYRRTG